MHGQVPHVQLEIQKIHSFLENFPHIWTLILVWKHILTRFFNYLDKGSTNLLPFTAKSLLESWDTSQDAKSEFKNKIK
jgi:hypothetical protein